MTAVEPCSELEKAIERKVCRQFAIALLLTANVTKAEAAVLTGIESLCLDHDVSSDAMIRSAVRAAIDAKPETEEALSMLPLELMRVLRLPAHLRFCFTLRVLAALPATSCASILGLEPREIDEAAGRAAQVLALSVTSSEPGSAAEFEAEAIY